MTTIADQLNRTPLTYFILLAYVTLACVTGLWSADFEKLMTFGAARGFNIMSEPWRLLAHAFLHGGALHLALNSYFLIIFGPMVERALGTPRFALLYVVSAVGGGIAGTLWNHPFGLLVGGSGALFGMMGAALAMNMRQGRQLLELHAGSRQLIGLIAVNLVLGMLIPVVSNSAHIGGLIGGFAVTFCFLTRRRDPIDAIGRVIQIGWIALFATLILYCVQPVLRTDYLVQRFQQAINTSNERDLRAYAEVLVQRDHVDYIRPEKQALWLNELRRWAPGG